MRNMSGSNIEQTVEKLLQSFTIEEKVDYIGGYKEFNIRAMERLGLPEIRMSDGPVGCRNYEPTTAYPATVGLAASWNAELAEKFGKALGRDCRARGVHILLAPGVNIYRSPLCGRNFEYMGEDPFLASRVAVGVIRGIQDQGVLATVKHYAANNQEYDRHHTSSEIDERTLREIYLPAFHAAVTEGNVACVMNAYNLLNGIHCTQHEHLNVDILKKEWGFDGILMSDWASTYDGVGAANCGLDIEMPNAKFMNRACLLEALKDGRVKESTIDDKVRRILRTIIRNGLHKRDQTDRSIPFYDQPGAKTALEIAREAVVLLKNDNNVLPFNPKKIKSIAVMGPTAHPVPHGGGGSSYTSPFRVVSVLDGLTQVAGDDFAVYYDGVAGRVNLDTIFHKSAFLCHREDGCLQEGLHAEYFMNPTLSGEPARKQVDRFVNIDWPSQRPDWVPQTGFSVRWTGLIRPRESGKHAMVARCDDGMRVWLDGKIIMEDWTCHPPRLLQADLKLEAGREYDLKIEYFDAGGGATAQVGWMLLPDAAKSAFVRLAAKVDAVVFCAGFPLHSEGEGADRRFALPEPQDDLIRMIRKVNPNLVVVLFAGGSVATEKWIDKAPAVLHAWYPGQEGGKAIAEVILGKINPSAKLPMTFERRAEDNPSFKWYPATDKKTYYREGIFVGYRGYDKNHIKPLFCFGHGLSYTKFDYSKLSISPSEASSGAEIAVKFSVRNAGRTAGAEVAQLYVRDVESSVERPPKELKGFAKVFLKPGQTKPVNLKLKPSDLAFYDVDRKGWITEPGRFEILIGSSSRDIRLKGKFSVK